MTRVGKIPDLRHMVMDTAGEGGDNRPILVALGVRDLRDATNASLEVVF